jgi:hypothetical protein
MPENYVEEEIEGRGGMYSRCKNNAGN